MHGVTIECHDPVAVARPTVTIVFLVHNRCDALRESLVRMTREADYDPALVDVVVVDNGSEDGCAEMVEREFPEVRLVRREVNSGISAFNDGLSLATGEFVLMLDDDCYLPADGLRRAVEAARLHRADLVSFGVCSSLDPAFRFDRFYRTGLLTFWGCAALVRRQVVEALDGYDPEIFVWANELDFTLRLYDRGFRHLHLPDVVAVHMKAAPVPPPEYYGTWQYRMNCRHFAYIAAKLLWPGDAVAVLRILLTRAFVAGLTEDGSALRGFVPALRGFVRGLRRRRRLDSSLLSDTYRRNLHDFASPFEICRPFTELALALPREWFGRLRGAPRRRDDAGRFSEYIEARPRYYPAARASLDLSELDAIVATRPLEPPPLRPDALVTAG